MWFLVVIVSLIVYLSSVIVSYSSWPPFPISCFLMFQNMFECIPPCSISLSIWFFFFGYFFFYFCSGFYLAFYVVFFFVFFISSMLLFWHASLNFCLCFFLMLWAVFISSFVFFLFFIVDGYFFLLISPWRLSWVVLGFGSFGLSVVFGSMFLRRCRCTLSSHLFYLFSIWWLFISWFIFIVAVLILWSVLFRPCIVYMLSLSVNDSMMLVVSFLSIMI